MRIARTTIIEHFGFFQENNWGNEQVMMKEGKDFSKIEEVLTAFDSGKESWNLKIVPSMGTLSEWKGYYDDKDKA